MKYFTVALTTSSCKKDVPVIDSKVAYQPTDIGHFVIYEVDSITYDDFFMPVKIDTANFEIKELIESSFTDNLGNLTYRIERYRRNNDTLPWGLIDVWQMNKFVDRMEKTEDNLKYTKLIFPPTLNKEWQGNSYIDTIGNLSFLADWGYQITALDVSKTINSSIYDSTLTVEGIDSENLIEKILKEKTYAKHVGLVELDYQYLQTQVISVQPWEIKAEKGFVLKMKIKSWGVQ